MDLHDHFFAQFYHHPKIVSVVLKGTKLLQSMCLLKPPVSGWGSITHHIVF